MAGAAAAQLSPTRTVLFAVGDGDSGRGPGRSTAVPLQPRYTNSSRPNDWLMSRRWLNSRPDLGH